MSNASSDLRDERPQIWVGETPWPVRLVHHAQSRRYKLIFDGARGELRLTLPRRANAARALKWASEQQDWLAEQVGKAAPPLLVGPGTAVPLFGAPRRIDWSAAAPRAVRLQKRLIRQWEDLPLSAAIAAGIDAFAAAYETDEPITAMQAFLDAKRRASAAKK